MIATFSVHSSGAEIVFIPGGFPHSGQRWPTSSCRDVRPSLFVALVAAFQTVPQPHVTR